MILRKHVSADLCNHIIDDMNYFVIFFEKNSSLRYDIFLLKVVCDCLQVDGSLLAYALYIFGNEEFFGVILKA